MINGLLVVRKEQGITSHKVVELVRRIFGTKKVGHFGTLDPIATGVLLVALGKVTRFFDYYVKKEKTYSGLIRFGYATTTHDIEGEPLSDPREIDLNSVDLESIMKGFIGKILQLPPLFSAKKIQGVAMHRLARRNIPVERKPVPVEIHSLDWQVLDRETLGFTARTSAGTYIRSLAHDIGEKTGCGAYLASLQRDRVGEFSCDSAHTIDEIRACVSTGEFHQVLLPMESLLGEYPKVVVNGAAARGVANGMEVPGKDVLAVIPALEAPFYRIFDDEGKFLALACNNPVLRTFKPLVVVS